MLNDLVKHALSGSQRQLHECLASWTDTILQTADQGPSHLVEQAEKAILRDGPQCFSFDENQRATLKIADHSFNAGHFSTPTLGELSQQVSHSPNKGSPRLFVIDGVSPVTDIGSLQAFAPSDTMFQVASQFNCLESPDPHLARVADYFYDPTQGPRAAISCFAGTLLRHYAAPRSDGTRFVQADNGEQINLLEAICDPDVAQVIGGYLMTQHIKDFPAFLALIQERFWDIKIGVHTNIEVTLGYNWRGAVPNGPKQVISQVFTSTLAAGGYSHSHHNPDELAEVCVKLQCAAQYGSIFAAAATGAKQIVLTLIGGGVFGNPLDIIWDSICWATDQLAEKHVALDIFVNGRTLANELGLTQLNTDTNKRNGTVIRVR